MTSSSAPRYAESVARPSGGKSEYLIGRKNGLVASVRAGKIILTLIESAAPAQPCSINGNSWRAVTECRRRGRRQPVSSQRRQIQPRATRRTPLRRRRGSPPLRHEDLKENGQNLESGSASIYALGGQRYEAEGDDTQAVDHRCGVQTKRGTGVTGGDGREAERQVGDDEGDREQLAAFAGRGDAG